MTDEIDAIRIDRERRLDLADDAGQVRRIVDTRSIQIAARVGRIPELAPVAIACAVWIRIEVAASRRLLPKTKVGVLFAARGAVPMEDEKERRRLRGVISRRDVDGHGPIAANDHIGTVRRDDRGGGSIRCGRRGRGGGGCTPDGRRRDGRGRSRRDGLRSADPDAPSATATRPRRRTASAPSVEARLSHRRQIVWRPLVCWSRHHPNRR